MGSRLCVTDLCVADLSNALAMQSAVFAGAFLHLSTRNFAGWGSEGVNKRSNITFEYLYPSLISCKWLLWTLSNIEEEFE